MELDRIWSMMTYNGCNLNNGHNFPFTFTKTVMNVVKNNVIVEKKYLSVNATNVENMTYILSQLYKRTPPSRTPLA